MGSGTTEARPYRNPCYYVLHPRFIQENKLYLSSNGVVLVEGTVPPDSLVYCTQKPSLSTNVLHVSMGHVLPQSVSLGSWPAHIEQARVDGEKGVPPEGASRRQTAWEFMGVPTPTKYLRLVFPGSSVETEEPVGTSAQSPTAGQGSSAASSSSKNRSGHSKELEIPVGETLPGGHSTEVETPRMGDPVDEITPPTINDIFIDAATSSFAATNPWILYEANVTVALDPRNPGEVLKNSTGEKVVALIEWKDLAENQRLNLIQQGLDRAEWEKVAWSGHQNYLFLRAWELGRLKSHYMRIQDYDRANDLNTAARYAGFDWMRKTFEPDGYATRHIDYPEPENWPQEWHEYERNEFIQKDFEWLAEAVYDLFQNHLTQLIRQNHLLWGDFCKRIKNVSTGADGPLLDLIGGNVEVSKDTVQPEPEKHFSFSTRLMMFAIDQYQSRASHVYRPFTSFCVRRLRQFVEFRKEKSQADFRHIVLHAYNQFTQHASFWNSEKSKTKCTSMGFSQEGWTSTKLEGYTWVFSEEQGVHVPKDIADEVVLDVKVRSDVVEQAQEVTEEVEEADEEHSMEIEKSSEVADCEQDEEHSMEIEKSSEPVAQEEPQESEPEDDLIEIPFSELTSNQVSELAAAAFMMQFSEEQRNFIRRTVAQSNMVMNTIDNEQGEVVNVQVEIDPNPHAEPLARVSWMSCEMMISLIETGDFDQITAMIPTLAAHERQYNQDFLHELQLSIKSVRKATEDIPQEELINQAGVYYQ